MNYRQLSRACSVLLAILFFAGTSVSAEDPRFISAYHIEYGLKLLNDEKFDLAVERFTKAFLLDPQNKTAKDSLQNIVAARFVSSSQGLKIMRFIDQVEYLEFLNMRYEVLAQENARLLEYLSQNNALPEDVAARLEAKASVSPRVGLIGFSGDDARNADLTTLINELSTERQKLAAEVRLGENQNEELRNLRKTFLAQKATDHSVVAVTKIKTQLEEATGRVVEKDELLAVQHQNIEYFKSELSTVRENFASLQDKFKETDAKINDLTERIMSMSVELFEKNKIIGEKEERVLALEKELLVSNERMGLVQKIIQEKDDQIRDRVISLEVQYADLTTKYQAITKELTAKDILAKEYRMAFLETDEKANQLIGMVEIYREKLVETKKDLALKEAEIQQMQQLLDGVPSHDLTFSQAR